jgi:hypothetical protein
LNYPETVRNSKIRSNTFKFQTVMYDFSLTMCKDQTKGGTRGLDTVKSCLTGPGTGNSFTTSKSFFDIKTLIFTLKLLEDPLYKYNHYYDQIQQKPTNAVSLTTQNKVSCIFRALFEKRMHLS